MFRHPSIVLLLAGSCLLAARDARAEERGDKGDAGKIARLIGELASDEFGERDRATRDLDRLGPSALKALQEAARSDDAEVRRRAGELVERISRRLETARYLEAKQVRIVCKDTPVTEAVQDLARKTGFPVQLEGNTAALANRKLTLDTGETTFWKAFDQFCRQAGVREKPGQPPQEYYQAWEGKGRRIMIWDESRAYLPAQDARLVLTEGKPPEAPTTYQAGALRVRMLPPEGDGKGPTAVQHQRGDGELVFMLEVTPEPRVQWLSTIDFRVEKAADDRGQALTQARPFRSESAPAAIDPYSELGLYNPYGGVAARSAQNLPVRLAFAAKPSATLKELKGVIFAQVRAPLEPLATVDNVLKAAGSSVTGLDGGAVKVIEVSREANGQVKLHVQVEQPPQDHEVWMNAAGRMLIIRGQMNQQLPQGLLEQLTLYDAGGERVPLLVNESRMESNGAGGVHYHLTYKPNSGQGEPSRFVYSGRRTVVLEVPFTLQDVPLPK